MNIYEVYFVDHNGNFQEFLMCAESDGDLRDQINNSQIGWNNVEITLFRSD